MSADLEVRWPFAQVQVLRGIEANQIIRIEERYRATAARSECHPPPGRTWSGAATPCKDP
ncbi:MAG TPA: hypothetical protein VHZ55_12250 [Bryobacteraceae bacterium]|nr:hypothetical protein [Bryobacteraceae bacterium]